MLGFTTVIDQSESRTQACHVTIHILLDVVTWALGGIAIGKVLIKQSSTFIKLDVAQI